MPAEGERKKQLNKLNYQRKKSVAVHEDLDKKYKWYDEELQRILNEVDPTGPRYKSEALSMTQLNALFQVFVFGQTLFKEEVAVEDFDKWLEYRDRARKDLFWLGVTVLHWNWEPRVHQPVCDFFVQKNFDGCFPEDYTLGDVHKAIQKQDRDKYRMLLDPRAHYKTTIDSVDVLQWLINVSDIRILILTAEEENSDDFVRQIKDYLYQPKGRNFTDFQLLFPEYILRGRDGSSVQPFTLAVRKHGQKDPTLWADSIMATLATQHCDILKGDDVVSNRNSDTEDTRAKLKRKFDGAIHLLDSWGYFDSIGTRYAPDDWYGLRLKAVEEGARLKYMVRACWTVKEGFENVPLKQLTLDMVDLLFPEKLGSAEDTFEYLRTELINNELDFRCQMLNEPAHVEDEGYVNNFTEENIRAAMMDLSWLPKSGKKYIFWDTSLTANRKSDYSAAAVYHIEERYGEEPVAWLVDLVYDHFTSTQLCQRIVSLTKRWSPELTFIEELPSTTDLFKKAVQEQKLLQGTDNFYINWFRPDSQAKAKETRIKGLELLITGGRLKIVVGAGTNASTYIDEMMKQMIGYTGHHNKNKNKSFISGRKDDIPDAMAYVYKVLPARVLGDPTEEQKAAEEAIRKKELDDRRYQAYFSGVMGSPAGMGSQFIVREGSNSASTPSNQEDNFDDSNPIYRSLKLLKRK